jgi:aryl-alcohol dehydrogenase-like predicted oxidoreductase
MEYVNLRATSLRVSRICLGRMSFGNDSDKPWMLDEEITSLEEPYVPHPVPGHG